MSLDGSYEADNVFARIMQGTEPCFRVYEDEASLAFLDIFPQGEGHTLVVPKGVQARNLLDLPHERLGPFMRSVQVVAEAIKAGLRPDGIEVQQLNGAAAGQTVFHLHFHVIPRTYGVPLTPHGAAARANDSHLETVAARIRSGLAER